MITENSFQVFSLNGEHTYTRDFKFGTFVNYKWIGNHFGNKIRMNPNIKLHEIADMVMKKYKCIVSPSQCRRAKRWALNEGENTMLDHYGYIRFYVCFNGLKEGWKKGCRRVTALDGCFLKKPNVGEILTTIERDENNHIFPVAWVVVNVENKDNWSWFLELLGEDLELPTRNGLALIKIMDKIKRANPNAYQYLLNKDLKTWSRAYFHIGTNCEVVENGFSECFNDVLLRVRNKPLITMLEAMRVIVMERMNTMRRMFWHVIPAGGNLFEVRNGSQAYSIDEQHRTCSCKMWQLSVLTPVGGMSFWPDCSKMSKVLPPKPKKMPGRPRKKIIRASHETKYPNKISRSGVQMTCSNCFQKGHNKSGCKNQTVLLPPKPLAKKGRPRKNPIPSEFINDQTKPLVPPCVPIPPVKEHLDSSQYEVCGSTSTVNASKTKKRVTFRENVANRGLSISGRGRGRGPRLGKLGAWFGINGNESDSIENTQEEAMHDSKIQES
ncbi:hypothetical protein Tco_0645445 [Tanacetum coccineum]